MNQNVILLSIQLATKSFQDSIAIVKTELSNLNTSFSSNNNVVTANNEATKVYSSMLVQTASDIKNNTTAINQNTSGIQQQKQATDKYLESLKQQKQNIQIVIDTLKQENTERNNTITSLNLQNKAITGKGTSDKEEKQNILAKIVSLKAENLENNESIAIANKSKIVTQEKINLAQKEVSVIKELVTEKALADKQNSANSNKATSDQLAFAKRNQQELSEQINNDIKKAQSNQKTANTQELEEGKVARKILEQIDEQDYKKKLAFVKQVNQEIKDGLKDGYNSAISNQKSNIGSQVSYSSIGLSANQKEQIKDIETLTNALRLQKSEIQTDINAHISLKNSIKGTSDEELKLKSNIDTSITGLKNQSIALEGSINELNRKKFAIQNNQAALNEHNSGIGQHVNNLHAQTNATQESSKATDIMSVKTVALGNFLANELSAGFHMALSAAEQFSEKSFEDFLKFEDGIHELKGIIGDGIKDVDSFKKDLIDLSFNLGQNVENDARFIKKVLTSGVVDKQDIADLKKQLNQPLMDIAEAKIEASKEIYEKAAKFSIASKVPIDDVVKAIITIKSNYKIPLEDIDELLNKLKVFGTRSKFELAEVIPQLGALSSAGIKAGRTLEEVLTSFATVGNGLETAPIAKTAIVNLIKKLTMPTANVKAEGALNGLDLSIKGMNDAGGLLGQLEKIKSVIMSLGDEAKRADFANSLFGGDQRAGTGFIQIINNLDKFKEVNNEVLNDTTKFRDLYEERIKSIEVRWQTFKNTLTDSMISFYDGNTDSINKLLELFTNLVNQMAGFAAQAGEQLKIINDKLQFLFDKDSPSVQAMQFLIWMLGNSIKAVFVFAAEFAKAGADVFHTVTEVFDNIWLSVKAFNKALIDIPTTIFEAWEKNDFSILSKYFTTEFDNILKKAKHLAINLANPLNILINPTLTAIGFDDETPPKIVAKTKPEGTVKLGKKGHAFASPSAFSGDTSDGSNVGNTSAVTQESEILKKFNDDSIKSHEEYIKARDGQHEYNILKIHEEFDKEIKDAAKALKAKEINQKKYDDAIFEYSKNHNARILDEEQKNNKKILDENKSANEKYITDTKKHFEPKILKTQAKIVKIESDDKLSKTEQLKRINAQEKHLQDIYNQEQKAFAVGSIAYEEAGKHREESQNKFNKNNQEIKKLGYQKELQDADNAIKHFENLEDQSDATKLKKVKAALEAKQKILKREANDKSLTSFEAKQTARASIETVTSELQSKQKEFNKKVIADKIQAEKDLTASLLSQTNERITEQNLSESKAIETRIALKKDEIIRINDLLAEAKSKKAIEGSKTLTTSLSTAKNQERDLETKLTKQHAVDAKQLLEAQYTDSLKALERKNKVNDIEFKTKKLSLEEYEKAFIDNLDEQIDLEQKHALNLDQSDKNYIKNKQDQEDKIKDLQNNRLLKEIDIENRIKDLNKSNALEITNAFSSVIDTVIPGFSKVFDKIIGKNEELQNSLLKSLGLFKEIPNIVKNVGASVGGGILEKTASVNQSTTTPNLSGYSKEFQDIVKQNLGSGSSDAMKALGIELGLTKSEQKAVNSTPSTNVAENSDDAKAKAAAEATAKAKADKIEHDRVESVAMAIQMGTEEVQKSVTALIENQTKAELSLRTYNQSLLLFGVNSKEAKHANQDLNESFTDNLKVLPGIGEQLSKLARTFTDFFHITRSQNDKKNDSDEITAEQNLTKAKIEAKADGVSKSRELLDNEYENNKRALSAKGEDDKAYQDDKLALEIKYNSDILKQDKQNFEEQSKLYSDYINATQYQDDTYDNNAFKLELGRTKRVEDLNQQLKKHYDKDTADRMAKEQEAAEYKSNKAKLEQSNNQKVLDSNYNLAKSTIELETDSTQKQIDLINKEKDHALATNELKINKDQDYENQKVIIANDAQNKINAITEKLNQSNYDSILKLATAASQKKIDILKSEGQSAYDVVENTQKRIDDLKSGRKTSEKQNQQKAAAFKEYEAKTIEGGDFYRISSPTDFERGENGNSNQRDNLQTAYDQGGSYDDYAKGKSLVGTRQYQYYNSQAQQETDPAKKQDFLNLAEAGRKEAEEFINDSKLLQIQSDNEVAQEKLKKIAPQLDAETKAQQKIKDDLDATFKYSSGDMRTNYVTDFRKFISDIKPDIASIGSDLYLNLIAAEKQFKLNDANANKVNNYSPNNQTPNLANNGTGSLGNNITPNTPNSISIPIGNMGVINIPIGNNTSNATTAPSGTTTSETWDQKIARFKIEDANVIRKQQGLALLPLPSYDVGSNYVPNDQVAQIHEGEGILTKRENALFNQNKEYFLRASMPHNYNNNRQTSNTQNINMQNTVHISGGNPAEMRSQFDAFENRLAVKLTKFGIK